MQIKLVQLLESSYICAGARGSGRRQDVRGGWTHRGEGALGREGKEIPNCCGLFPFYYCCFSFHSLPAEKRQESLSTLQSDSPNLYLTIFCFRSILLLLLNRLAVHCRPGVRSPERRAFSYTSAGLLPGSGNEHSTILSFTARTRVSGFKPRLPVLESSSGSPTSGRGRPPPPPPPSCPGPLSGVH